MSVSRIDEPVGFHTSYQSTRLIQIVGDDTFLVLDILASLEDFQHTVYCAAHYALAVFRVEENLFVAERHSYLIQCLRDDELVLIAAAIGPWTLLVVAVLIIGTLKCCLTTDSDSIDESINKSPGIVAHVMVLDSTDNGFRVVYATAEPVTDERFAEICDRPGILEGFENLKRKAPEHFGGNLLETDICDFALYAYRFPIDKDVRIHNIFVAGKEKMDFYVRNNPDLPGCATWMHHGTEQGNQYLNADDINHCIPNGRRIYRYWKCRYLLQTSDTDERFSHFTEEERLY